MIGYEMFITIRDDALLVHMQETPYYRIVRIELTDEQNRKLMLRTNGRIGTKEKISNIVIQER